MASSSMKSAVKAVNLLGKRKQSDGLETKLFLKKHKDKEKSEEKEFAVIKKSVFVFNLHVPYNISEIINFFKDVGKVVHLRLTQDPWGMQAGIGFVSFASPHEAKAALAKNGEYFLGTKIFLSLANLGPSPALSKYEDYLGRESLPAVADETPPYFSDRVLFVANLSPQTKVFHLKRFFHRLPENKDTVEIVSIRLIVNQEGKHVGYGFVEFASAAVADEALEKRNGEYLHDHKIFLDLAKSAPHPPRPKYNLSEMLCYEDHLRHMEVLSGTPDFVEAVAAREKTLFVDHLSRQTEISHIINFFKDVGEVVHVRLVTGPDGMHVGCGLVEFASVNQAKKALEKKNGEYLHDHPIFLDVAKNALSPPRPKLFIDHKVWYEDYLRREGLLMEEDKAVSELVEEVNVRKKTLFASNLNKSKISTIIHFFKDVGEVIGVRLIVDYRGKRVGCGFVEFASANVAKKALKKDGKHISGNRIVLEVAERAPYPLQTKYNLAEKLWYEENLRREGPLMEDEIKPNQMGLFCGKKITLSDDD